MADDMARMGDNAGGDLKCAGLRRLALHFDVRDLGQIAQHFEVHVRERVDGQKARNGMQVRLMKGAEVQQPEVGSDGAGHGERPVTGR